MKLLLIIEHHNDHLASSTYHSLNAAQQLTDDIDVFIIGFECGAIVKEAQQLPFIKKILLADAQEYQHFLAENTAELLINVAHHYQYIMMSSSTSGKNLMPRLSALLDVTMITDVINIISADTFERPIYAGNAIATVQSLAAIKLLTVRATSFAAAPPSANNAPIEIINKIIPNTLSHFEHQELTIMARPELAKAQIIVAGGRGLKNAENFKLIEKLADRLGGAVGATRAAVDAGFASNDYQIGQTGKIVAPHLYFAIGISGAIQHLAGIKDSKVIVAINNDPEAPIFDIADYGLVADLFSAITELLEAL